MIDVKRGDELGEPLRRKLTEVLVTGFAEDFAYFSSDPERLIRAFEHMVLLERFYVASVDGIPAAVASVTSDQQECFAPERRLFQRHLGAWHGLMSFWIIRSQFLGTPEEARDGLAEIGFVTTSPAFQGRGVGTTLMERILRLPGYDEFILREIKDTNDAALGLYRKFGFVEYRRRPVRFARKAGFNSYISLRLEVESG